MGTHTIKKGLDLPIEGAPVQEVSDGPKVSRVAVLNDDYPFMKPRMCVNEGDEVKRGQVLFEDRKATGVLFTSPGAGRVVAVNRGERRKLESVVIELSEGERSGAPAKSEVETFTSYKDSQLGGLSGEDARALLSRSGMWTAFRARPYSRVPSIDETCHSIFVTVTDTNPLAPSMDKVLEGREEDFTRGLKIVAKLTEGPVWLCKSAGSKISGKGVERVREETFVGKHPAGLVGTHIHTLDPVHRGKVVWHIGGQDVAAIGKLFATGELDLERVISVGGPGISSPRLLRVRVGTETEVLVKDDFEPGEIRVISGSVFNGHDARGEVFGFLGRYDQQLACLAEGRERVMLGWLGAGPDIFTTVRAYLGGVLKKKFKFTTTTNGSHRAMVPIGMFERVMPLDILPTFLLRALAAGDLSTAEKMGCLELDEEDLGLCSFVSPGKEDFGRLLRQNLTRIWKEG